MPTSKQRRDAEHRRLERQVQRRAERQAARRRLNLIISVIGTVVVIAVVIGFVIATGNDDKKTSAGGTGTESLAVSAAGSSTSSAAAQPAYPCTWKKTAKAARPAKVPSTTKPARKGTVLVDLTTSQGALTFTLDRAKAPCAVASFVSLAEQGYFNGTSCHRLTTTGIYVLQCGDPLGNGSGGPGYSFGDELTGKEKYTRGVLAMANSGPNTNGSQFFIVYKDSTLAPGYTVFGSITKGLPAIDKVAAGGAEGTTGDGKPKLPVKLTKVLVQN
jgi:peptidyl-prolyl cis-trans isomerase B (cyclophilin B)